MPNLQKEMNFTWVEGLTKSYEAKDKEQFLAIIDNITLEMEQLQEAEKEKLEKYRHAFFQTVQPLSGATLVSLIKALIHHKQGKHNNNRVLGPSQKLFDLTKSYVKTAKTDPEIEEILRGTPFFQ